MNASRVGSDVVKLTVSAEEARALGRTWKVDDGAVSVLLSDALARELRSALSAALLNDPKEAA